MKRYLDTFFRYWFIVLVPVIVLPAIEFLMVRKMPQTVIASTNIFVGQAVGDIPTDGSQWLSPAQNTQGELGQWLQSPSFDLAVAQSSPAYVAALRTVAAPRDTVFQDLSRNLWLTPKGSAILNITYSSSNWLIAQQVVQGLIDLARTKLRSVGQQHALASIDYYKFQLKTAQQKESQSSKNLSDYITAHNIPRDQLTQESASDPTLATLSQQNMLDRNNVVAIQQKIAGYQWENIASTLPVVQGQYTQIDPVSLTLVSKKKAQLMDIAIALVVALLLGGGFIAAKTVLDTSLRFPDDVHALLDLPVLAVVPYSTTLATRGARTAQVGKKPSARGALAGLRRTG